MDRGSSLSKNYLKKTTYLSKRRVREKKNGNTNRSYPRITMPTAKELKRAYQK